MGVASHNKQFNVPYNIASYAALMVIIEAITGYTPRYLIGDLSNVHIYEPHVPAVKEYLKREPSKNRVDLQLNVSSLTVKDIMSLEPDDFVLKNYKPQGVIKAEMLAISNENWNK